MPCHARSATASSGPAARSTRSITNLSPETRKKAYNDAKLFATQAEEAINAANLVFAKELADKAERLAKELQGR